MLRKSLDFVHVQFYGAGVECWQTFFRHIVFVPDKFQFGVVLVDPVRKLPVGNQEYFVYPWGIRLNGPEPIFENLHIPKSGFRHVAFRVRAVFGV